MTGPAREGSRTRFEPMPSSTAPASRRVRAALERSVEDARTLDAAPGEVAKRGAPDGRTRTLEVAIGDAQAPIEIFLEILDRHDLLTDDGTLHPDLRLVSLGDHFDWGRPDETARAAQSGFRLLSWLANHPADQAILMASNHDLARVSELVAFDDDTFTAARKEATLIRAIPFGTPGRAERRQALLESLPEVPSIGVLARDWASFEARQRDLVAALLRAKRYQAAWAAAHDLLIVHAAVTPDDLSALGEPEPAPGDARAMAAAVQRAFDDAVDAWDGERPFAVPPLYRPGSFADGESRGIFVQRPADPEAETNDSDLFEGPPRRRYDPRGLHPGVTIVCGHIRDNKCRELMPDWCDDEDDSRDGPLRHLWATRNEVRYERGVPDGTAREAAARGERALVIFVDGGMNHTAPTGYEVLDLGARRAL
jgi:hypothetical protein